MNPGTPFSYLQRVRITADLHGSQAPFQNAYAQAQALQNTSLKDGSVLADAFHTFSARVFHGQGAVTWGAPGTRAASFRPAEATRPAARVSAAAAVVDWVPPRLAAPQEARRRCRVASHKALVTRLLFILTRCSRLVVSDDPAPGEPRAPAS